MSNRKRSMGRPEVPKVECTHCLLPSQLRFFTDKDYPYTKNYGPVYICVLCEAWVGCHKGTEQPLGAPANAALRQARQRVHAVFDPSGETSTCGEVKPTSCLLR